MVNTSIPSRKYNIFEKAALLGCFFYILYKFALNPVDFQQYDLAENNIELFIFCKTNNLMKCFEKCDSVKFTAKKEACYLIVASFF